MQTPAVLTSKALWALAGLLAAAAWMVAQGDTRREAELHNVVISEILAFNTAGLTDRDGDTSDWIELFNRGTVPVDLGGTYLTDDMGKPRRWPMPDVTIEPGDSLIVFASGKDRRFGELHTNFRLGERGEFVGLVGPNETLISGFQPGFPQQPPNTSYGLASASEAVLLVGPESEFRVWVATDGRHATAWTQPEFDDSAWRNAHGGVGFDQGPQYRSMIGTDVSSMHDGATSVYLRIPFQLHDPDSIARLSLRVRYDDGFVAFLNGQEVALDNAPTAPRWDTVALDSRPDDQAIRFRRFDLTGSRELLVEGKNVLAIQGMNMSAESPDFLIAPMLSGVVGDPTMTGPPVFLDESTPGRVNGSGHASVADPPTPTVDSGLYFDSVTVSLDAASEGTIHYTLDGSLPDRISPRYDGPLTLDRSARLRARQFHPDRVGSPPVDAHYVVVDSDLKRFDSNLPIVLLETFERGVSPDSFSTAFLHIFEEEGRVSIDQPTYAGKIAVKHRGSTTLRYPKRSMAIELQDELGRDRASALLGMPADSDWILYGPFNYDRSLIRNTLIYELSNRIGRYAPRTRFVEVFAHHGHGPLSFRDYFGVYVLMEKIKRGPHRVDVEEILPSDKAGLRLAGGYIVKIDRNDPGDRGFAAAGEDNLNFVYPKEGQLNRQQAEYLREYFEDFGRALVDRRYEEFIDVPSWIDHHILQELSRNPDSHRYSTFLFKTRAGRLQMGPVWDFDRSMGADDTQRARTRPNPSPVGRSRFHYYGWWQRLLNDPELVRRYRHRWVELRQGPFRVENLEQLVDEMAEELAEAQTRNFRRWPVDLGDRGWAGKIEHLRNWITTRVTWLDLDLIGSPEFSHRAGRVEPGTSILISPTVDGEVHYTLDGTDPRGPDGHVVPTAKAWSGPLRVHEDTVVSARERVTDDIWGKLERRRYIPGK